MICQGDTFWIPSENNTFVEHLYVVISDPLQDPDNVVMVSLTSRESWKDQSCIVYVEEHSALTHESCIDYRRAKIVKAEALERAVEQGKVWPRDRVSGAVLLKILKGASQTQNLPNDCDKILDEQGLIE